MNLHKKARTFARLIEMKALKFSLQLEGRYAPESAAARAEALFSTPRHHARPVREKDVLATATAFEVSSPQGTIKAWRWGNSEAIVGLVHGWSGRGSQFYAWIEPLLAAGLSVVTYDAPAHGDSPGVVSSLPEMAQSLLAVQAATGPWVGVASHSLGAAATLFALEFGLQAERVILIASPSEIGRSIGFFGKAMGLPTAVRQEMQTRLERRLGLEIDTINLHQMASRRSEKALLLHDLDDRQVNWNNSERLNQAWQGSHLLTTKGLGHSRILSNATLIQQAQQFFTDTWQPETLSPNMQHLIQA